MKNLISITSYFALLLFSSLALSDSKIAELEFADSNIQDVVRTLSELSDSNIIATPKATKKQVTIHLKKVTVLEAIKSISRITDLWYRYDDDTNTYRIMTREEYASDLIVRESEHIEVFNVLNANVQIIAQSIQDLYGSRVVLSMGTAAGAKAAGGSASGGGRSSVRNSRATGRSNRSTAGSGGTGGMATSGSQLNASNLSIDQVDQLSKQLSGSDITVNAQVLQQVSIQAQPIYVTVNNEHSMILVRTDDRNVIKSIESLIKKMDKPIPQVMLEMKILNIILGEDFNSIFNFELQPSGGNQSLQPIKIGNNALFNSGSFIYEFLNSRLQANIDFLQQNKRVKVLSNPMVLASNHREADLFIGEERLLTRGFTYNPAVRSDTGAVISPPYVETETELEEIGITLRITPQINADDTVSLDIQQENSTLQIGAGTLPITDGQGNVRIYPVDTVNTSRLTGTVVARNNLTVAIGGLIRSSKSSDEKKVPILGEIPVLGRLFTSTTETEQDTEMVLLITPRILNKPGDSEALRQEDNTFYQSYNDGFPELEPYPNKFIDKQTSVAKPSVQNGQSGQNVYLEMSQYAADTIRIDEIERTLDSHYLPSKVSRHAIAGLFDNAHIKVIPLASWNRGGLHVTAIELANKSNSAVTVDYQNIKGKWLASSVESDVLARRGQANDSTFMYVISALSFDETIAEMK